MVKYLHQNDELFVLRKYCGWPTPHLQAWGDFSWHGHGLAMSLVVTRCPPIRVKDYGILGTSECLGCRWRRLVPGVIGLKRGYDHQESSGSWGRVTSLCPGSQALYLTLNIVIGWAASSAVQSCITTDSEGATVWFGLSNCGKVFNIIQLALDEKPSRTQHRRGLS